MAITLQCQLKIDPTPSLSLELFPTNISLLLPKVPYMLGGGGQAGGCKLYLCPR